MKAIKEIVYKLELSEKEFNTVKECLHVFQDQGLNEKITGRIGLSKLSRLQLETLSEVSTYLEVIE